jgi:hypothetical protein
MKIEFWGVFWKGFLHGECIGIIIFNRDTTWRLEIVFECLHFVEIWHMNSSE